MQKKLIALAVAGLATGTVAAQTNVTVYGVADVGYVYSVGDAGRDGAGIRIPGKNKFSGLAGGGVQAGNRLGFKGEEALGNGLKAVFTLEYALELDRNVGPGNTGGLNARQQFVGLSSKLGTVALGRQYAPGFDAAANNDALEATDMSIQSNFSVYAGNSITPNSPSRYNNAISYTSNSMGGLTLKAIYGFGENAVGGLNNTSTSDNGRLGLGANYANGPVNLDVVYHSRQNVTVAYPNPAGLGKDINEWYVGGAWDFGPVKAYASYQALDNRNSTTLGTDDNNLWTVGVSVPVFKSGLIGLSYGKLSIDRKNAPDGESTGWGAMYTHSLSKRTAVYVAYTFIDNDRRSIAIQTQVANGGEGIGAVGESNHTLGTGIRHSF